jgi:hypothetical protein
MPNTTESKTQMSATGWQDRLKEASTQEGVVIVCNEYLGLWKPEELAELPATCWPNDVIGLEDVSPYALKLIAAVGVGDRSTAPMLYKMSTFFTKAALRLAEIMGPRAQVPPDQRQKSSSRSP